MSKSSFMILLISLTVFIVLIVVASRTDLKTVDVEASAPESIIESLPEVSSEPEIEEKIEYIYYDVPLDIDTQRAIIEICAEYDFEYELILGVISVESDFRPKIIGDDGKSFGLMQIQPKWWSKTMEREGVTNLLDPLQNVRCGCAILKDLKEKYRTEYRALQAYNTGRPNTNNGYAERVYNRMDGLVILGEG